ncbi:MAG TPA: methyltransferase domain-containing protein [Candidatus Saccharimonadales bacterium]|nr:methyltransferase domain-containing protein [Candidatus Saccharimonadales bacterium]
MSFEKRYPSFANREGRAQFIADSFTEEIAEAKTILDVGCDFNTLKKIVGAKVVGVDLYGAPDIVIDFEKDRLSHFRGGQFDMVVCTEVLEHLDNLHAMVQELHRVSSRYILVSLPNCLNVFAKWNILFHGKVNKYYGLPFERPDDRHRWFFSYKDIDRFFINFCKTTSCRVRRKFLQVGLSAGWRGRLVRFFVELFNINNAAQSYWILLEKPQRLTARGKKR